MQNKIKQIPKQLLCLLLAIVTFITTVPFVALPSIAEAATSSGQYSISTGTTLGMGHRSIYYSYGNKINLYSKTTLDGSGGTVEMLRKYVIIINK